MKGKLIGKGTFTKVYEHATDKKKVVYETNDQTKLCLAEWLDENQFYPQIEKVYEGDKVYLVGKRYEKVTAPKRQLKPFHYKIYKMLREISFQCHYNFYALHEAFSVLPKRAREALQEQLDALGNYINIDDICFEISPRNILTDNKGNLILADLFFDRSELRKIKKF